MRSGVTVTRDLTRQVLGALRRATHNEVLIGIPSENIGREDEAGRYVGGINNAVIGYVQEFGSPLLNIPARPFLVPGVEAIKPQAIEHLGAAVRRALDGDQATIGRALHAVGLIGQAAVRRRITDGEFAPLSERTLQARARRGVTRTKPLIDTGQLRAAVSYVVRPR